MDKISPVAGAPIQAILFDLDGTLIASSHDLGTALNYLLEKYHKPPVSLEKVACNISEGVTGLLRLAFSASLGHPVSVELKQQYLVIYKQLIKEQCTSYLYQGIDRLLDKIDEKKIPWGIVTNRSRELSLILLDHVKLSDRCAVLVAGDDVSEPKPSPEPLLKACAVIDCQPEYCIYAGDNRRDIIAGKRAKMTTISAAYGYLEENEEPGDWEATCIVKQPKDILSWLEHNQWKQP